MVVALRATEKADLTEELAKRAAAARSSAELEGVRMAVKAICDGEVVTRPQSTRPSRSSSSPRSGTGAHFTRCIRA
jgi:hypothetical protein